MTERVHVFLLLRSGGENQRIVVWDTQDIKVGREPGNDVVVDDPEMSREHARFRKDGAAFVVDNLSTSNPTLVNGEPVTTQALKGKDVVRIADTELVFYRSTDNPVTLGIKTEFASQLKGFGPKVGGDGEATVLGLMDPMGGEDEFQVQRAGDFDHDLAGMNVPAAPRNLDLELGGSLEDLEMPAGPAAGAVSLTLEIAGLTPDQQRFLKGLLGKVVQLPALSIRVKGHDLS